MDNKLKKDSNVLVTIMSSIAVLMLVCYLGIYNLKDTYSVDINLGDYSCSAYVGNPIKYNNEAWCLRVSSYHFDPTNGTCTVYTSEQSDVNDYEGAGWSCSKVNNNSQYTCTSKDMNKCVSKATYVGNGSGSTIPQCKDIEGSCGNNLRYSSDSRDQITCTSGNTNYLYKKGTNTKTCLGTGYEGSELVDNKRYTYYEFILSTDNGNGNTTLPKCVDIYGTCGASSGYIDLTDPEFQCIFGNKNYLYKKGTNTKDCIDTNNNNKQVTYYEYNLAMEIEIGGNSGNNGGGQNNGGSSNTPTQPSNPNPGTSDQNQNVTENPKTGSIAIFLVWIMGIGMVIYSFAYFRKAKTE